MWTIKNHCVVMLLILSIIVSHSGEVRGDSKEDNLDKDFEFLEEEESSAPKVQDESPLSRDNDVIEMTTSHCSTADRTRVCDCGYTNQVCVVIIQVTHRAMLSLL